MYKILGLGLFTLLWVSVWTTQSLRPVEKNRDILKEFVIVEGESLSSIASRLEEARLIRSDFAFKVYAYQTKSAAVLRPGEYSLSPGMTTKEILDLLKRGVSREVQVVIPEGSTIFEVEERLVESGVLEAGELIQKFEENPEIEGYLFPDTYRLYKNENVGEVIERMRENFFARTKSELEKEVGREDLILASILEKEVPEYEDRRIVAGLLLKRLKDGMRLQVDASVCYIKQIKAKSAVPCYPLTSIDLKMASPYNTYVQGGWPVRPIGNPGIEALRAAQNPISSIYWYYLSDPETRKTIFSKTLDEHNRNKVKYLKR